MADENNFAFPESAHRMADIPYGGHFENCDSSSIIHDNELYNSTNGFYFKNCYDITIDNNTFDNCTNNSMEFYGDGGTKSYIENNHFLNSDKALIISPVQNPLGAGSSSNDNTSPMNIDISCNLFQNNNYGIIGSGDIIDQGNASYTNGNKFDNNADWDMVWMDFDSVPQVWFTFYNNGSINTEPNTRIGISRPNLYLNSHLITSTYNNFLDSTNSTNPSCYSSLKEFRELKENFNVANKYSLVHDQQRNELIVNHVNPTESLNTICYDVLGHSFPLQRISCTSESYKLDTRYLSPGIYYLAINGVIIKFYKL